MRAGAVLLLTLSACGPRGSSPSPVSSSQPALPGTALQTRTPTPAPTSTPSPTGTVTSTASLTPTASLTRTGTATATASPSPTQTLTPTVALPAVEVLEQANCRYGPGQAYLYSHGLYAGDRAEVHGRNASGSWLWIKPANLDRRCWAAASVLQVTGEVKSAPVVQTRLPHSTLYGPPQEVQAVRFGNRVQVSWSPVPMTEDDYRGYLIEASLCRNGNLSATAVHVDGLSYDFTDDGSCSGAGGRLYAVEKHGYTDPVEIPWP